jgi:steroid delta-isomerase-like uncharacterized protein
MDNKEIVRQFVEETLNRGNLAAAGQFMADDVVEQVPFPGQGPGLAGVVEVIRQMRGGFSDLHFEILEQIAEGDKVVSRFEWTGTHRGPFLGVPATGKSARVWGTVIDRLENGKIKDTRLIMDVMGLMIQLGVIPPPGA